MERDWFLVTPYLITENILKFLGARDLSRCACVCKLWNTMSSKEIKRRRRVTLFFQDLKCPHKMQSICIQCLIDRAYKFENELYKQFENLWIKPAFCIAFATSGFLEKFEILFPSHPTSKHTRKKLKRIEDDEYRHRYLDSVIRTALKKNLPPSCKVCLYIGDNIVAVKEKSSLMEANNAEPAITGYLFPDLPEEELKFCKKDKDNSFKTLLKVVKTHDIKTIIGLIEHQSMIYFAIAFHQWRHKVNLYEVGCALPVQRASNYILLFCGRNVETELFIVSSWESELARLQRLEERGFFKSQTIAFFFANDYKDFSLNCKLFNEMYPETHILGMYGKHKLEDTYNLLKGISFIKQQLENSLINLELKRECRCILISLKSFKVH